MRGFQHSEIRKGFITYVIISSWGVLLGEGFLYAEILSLFVQDDLYGFTFIFQTGFGPDAYVVSADADIRIGRVSAYHVGSCLDIETVKIGDIDHPVAIGEVDIKAVTQRKT